MWEMAISTKILRWNDYRDMVLGILCCTASRKAWVPHCPSFYFFSAYHTEVAVAILLKMIFRVFSFLHGRSSSRVVEFEMNDAQVNMNKRLKLAFFVPTLVFLSLVFCCNKCSIATFHRVST